MSADKPMNATIRKKQKRSEQRQIMTVLIAFVLIVFSLGTIFGCFLCSAFTPDAVKAVEETAPTAPQIKTPLDAEFQATMLEMCEKYELPFALALAVAEQESNFNPDAVSATDDYGLMQINKVNFDRLREKGIEPLDYEGNIEAGVLILSEAVKKYDDYGLALMVYNCGETGAKKLWGKGIYSTEFSRATMESFNKWDSYIRGF